MEIQSSHFADFGRLLIEDVNEDKRPYCFCVDLISAEGSAVTSVAVVTDGSYRIKANVLSRGLLC